MPRSSVWRSRSTRLMPRSNGASRLIATKKVSRRRCRRWAWTARVWLRRSTLKRPVRDDLKPPIAKKPSGWTLRSHRSSRSWICMSDIMAQVNATIAGRQFRLACEDGQEEQLQSLAKDIDQRIIDLRRKFGEIGDTRLTVMAALMLADELAEASQKLRRLDEEIAALHDARLVAADRARAASDAVVGAFNSAAERIEGITRKLNQTVSNGGSVAIG